jgi:hypothetical protein
LRLQNTFHGGETTAKELKFMEKGLGTTQIILFLSASPGDLQVHALESELSRARRATLIAEGTLNYERTRTN